MSLNALHVLSRDVANINNIVFALYNGRYIYIYTHIYVRARACMWRESYILYTTHTYIILMAN